jgi:hypothetical protein
MDNKQRQESLTIHYEEADGKRAAPVSGAYGGPSADGANVIVHVYSEWSMVPSIQQLPIDEKGVVHVSEGQTIKRGDLQREVQATLVMTPEVAVRIGEWLVGKGAAAIQAREPHLLKAEADSGDDKTWEE